jgi:O-antigen ligase
MQIADGFPQRSLPPSQGGAPDIADQLRSYQIRQNRILLRRTLQIWWYPVLFVILGGVAAATLGQFALDLPKVVIGLTLGVPLIYLAIRFPAFGLLLAAIFVSPFIPSALKVSTVYISPAIPFILLIFYVALVRAGLSRKKTIFPSLWTTWPLIGLIFMAILSELFAQATWLIVVPRQVLSNPIAFEEGIGVAMYFAPLIVVYTVSAILTGKDRWIRYILHTFLILALFDAGVLLIEFKHIGADIYTFRYTSPSIGWMPLEALAQLLALGCMIAYAHFLYAARWLTRILYGLAFVICLVALYFSLENSWWLEAAIALAVMTLVYSRRLFVFFCVVALPFLPLVRSFVQKLQSVKSVDALRFIIWQDMLRAWSKRPVFGVGPGNLWAYDQVFTHLPFGVRDFAKSGLGVAHEGYIQTLGELGPLGLFLQVACLVVLIIAAARLFRHSRSIDISEMRNDRILALVGLGLVCGSMGGDFFASYFFLPPRQSLHVASLPQALVTWIIYGCVLYKDQLRRMALKGLRFAI